MRSDEVTLLDIITAGKRIEQFVAGCDRDGFLRDIKSQSAVLHQLLIIGEAAKRLSAAFRDGRPSVPWRQIAGMRDKLIHGYDAVDLEEVWKTVSADVPALVRELSQ